MSLSNLDLFTPPREEPPTKLKPLKQPKVTLGSYTLPNDLALRLASIKKMEPVEDTSFEMQFEWDTGLYQEFKIHLGSYPFKVTLMKSPTMGDVLSIRILPTGFTECVRIAVLVWNYSINNTYEDESTAVLEKDATKHQNNVYHQKMNSTKETCTMYLTAKAKIYK